MTRTRVYAHAAHTTALALLATGTLAALDGAWWTAGLCWCFLPSLWFVAGRINATYWRERRVRERLEQLCHQDGRPLTGPEHAEWAALIARIDLPDDRSAA